MKKITQQKKVIKELQEMIEEQNIIIEGLQSQIMYYKDMLFENKKVN